MGMFDHLVEQRIGEAVARGDLDNLPGSGAPLPPEPDTLIPEDLRMAYRILRNAGFAPPEVSLRRQISDAREQSRNANDDGEKYSARARLQDLMLRLHTGDERHFNLVLQEQYYQHVIRKLSDH